MAAEKHTEELGPVAKARAIFNLTKDRSRSEAIDLAVAIGGVKRSTASTQYQFWKNHNH